ncbi:MAG: hypothetical protein M1393_03240 [Candidatus Thermoplasmatota archaeon]|jgi:hypothetical protein|nr:hypothetical protein [Candidatus Thermoplasmatota archaeon]
MDYSGLVIPILALVDGLLFGLAVKKGVVSFVLLVVAIVVSGYVGFSFIPQVSVTSLINSVVSYTTTHLQLLTTLIPIGNTGAVSLVVVLFVVGLGVGIWKG